MELSPQQTLIICGHYGAGKTNLAVNLALWAAGAEKGPVAVADLDLVNPYFRTADFRQLFSTQGIELIAPVYANTNLDIPVLPPKLGAVIGKRNGTLIIDVGGDDDGAVALGGYAHLLNQSGYVMLYVINALREPDPDPEEEASLLRAVEQSSRLQITGLVNNTNLGRETTPEVLEKSRDYVAAVSEKTGLPVLFTAASADIKRWDEPVFPVQVFVKPPWED